jgi:acetolactate synthase-1/2/3 large subunit
MEMLSGAEMVVQSLVDQGVKQVFGYPGGAVLDIYDALHTLGGIDHVLVRHEQAAVHMADGLARATGEVGVVLVTSGATNAITGIATAYMDSIPLVILSGQVATSLIGYDAFQECDMVGISRPVVKHSFLVKQTEDIPGVLKKAFWLAASGRPGPVVVDLPKDILNPAKKLPYVWPDAVSMRSYNPTTSGHKGQIKRALQTLVAAKAGRLRRRRGDQCALRTQLRELVEKLKLPVASS